MKLAGYIRCSTARQVDGYGLAVQRAEIEKWARREGHRIVHWCSDEAVSGASEAVDREGLSCALSAIEAGRVDGVVVARLDRLARLLTVQEAILSGVWKRGGRVFSADAGEVMEDDPDDPLRKAIRVFCGAAAELERGLIAVRMRRGRAMKFESGGYAYGAPPFGKVARDGDLVTDPNEAAAVDRIVALRADGMSLREIIGVLEDESIPTKRGGRWHPSTVRQILARAA